jgi:hypothetical protein
VAELAYHWGGFYDGTLRSAEAILTLKPSTRLRLIEAGERNDVSLPRWPLRHAACSRCEWTSTSPRT